VVKVTNIPKSTSFFAGFNFKLLILMEDFDHGSFVRVSPFDAD